MAAEEFGQRVHHDVGSVIDRLAQVRRCQRVVDDKRHAGLAGDIGNRLDVGDDAAGVGDRLDEDRLGLVVYGPFERTDIVRFGPSHVPAKILERMGELVDRAAVELGGGDQLVARLHQGVQGDHLRGVAGRERQSGGAAFERGDAFFQHGAGRIANAGVDIAEGLQAEQRGGVVDVVEHIGGSLVDRRYARAGCRVRLGARVNRKRCEAWNAVGVGHGLHPSKTLYEVVVAVGPGRSATMI